MTEHTHLLGRRAIVLSLIVSMMLSSFAPAFFAHAEEEAIPPQTETIPESPATETTTEEQTTSPEITVEDQITSPETTSTQSQEETTQTTLSDTQPTTTPETPENQGDAVVDTGDAAALTDAQNTTNTNTVDVTADTATTTITNTNTASTTNEAAAAASTGDNTAAGGSATVTTGDAIASANVINVVNTNIINSPGILAFFNMLFGGGFDLRGFDLSYFFGGGDTSTTGTQNNCSLLSCASDEGTLLVSNTNDATVTNTVLVRSNTGSNTASSTGEGDASVTTGDAYASANVFNLVNTNLINSNYLLVALNNFGDMFGDITLPGASFFETLMGGSGATNTSINNSNTATVTNNTAATADSGNNTATGGTGGDAVVTTGDAHSAASTYNQVNTNMVGGSTVFFLINIFGDWAGNVQGLPEGMTWTRTPTGIALMNESGGGGTVTESLSTLGVSNTNTANVTNNVQAWALTGANKAESTGDGDADIETGDAYASTNVVNMVNTNVIGKNWIFAIFNIFGNWSGNLSFGKPDLWIGAVAETPNPTLPGSAMKYHFTVSNRGDADATGVKLKAEFLKTLIKFNEGNPIDAGMQWDLGTIKKGETREFVYSANAGLIPDGTTASADLTASVSSAETDNNSIDNTEKLSVLVQSPIQTTGSAPIGKWTTDPHLQMTKKVSVATTTVPASVDYEVTIRNTGGAAYNVTLTDTLTDPKGGTVYKRAWKLNTIGENEEISLTYSVEYKGDLPLGKYKNTAQLKGQKGNSSAVYAVDMQKVTANATIELVAGGEVLGAATSKVAAPAPACAAFITSYISPNGTNSSVQVRRLQYFLRDFQNELLTPNGIYDEATIEAVKRFQEKYAGDVLMPWGMSDPSGVVYYTTQQKINELYCQGMKKFPLSKTQQQHIFAYAQKNVPLATAPATTTQKWSDAIEQFFVTQPVSPAVLLPVPKVATPDVQESTSVGFFGFNLGFFSLFSKLFALSPLYFDIPHAEAAGK